jgi:hypothetical protein
MEHPYTENLPKCPQCGQEATYQTPDGTFWDGDAHHWRLQTALENES